MMSKNELDALSRALALVVRNTAVTPLRAEIESLSQRVRELEGDRATLAQRVLELEADRAILPVGS